MPKMSSPAVPECGNKCYIGVHCHITLALY